VKYVKQVLITKNEENDKISKDNTNLKEKVLSLEKENNSLRNKNVELETRTEPQRTFECVSKNYELSFQKFLTNNIEKSNMASMMYGVSRNSKTGIGYVEPRTPNIKPKEM
jgi:hypothetical protein